MHDAIEKLIQITQDRQADCIFFGEAHPKFRDAITCYRDAVILFCQKNSNVTSLCIEFEATAQQDFDRFFNGDLVVSQLREMRIAPSSFASLMTDDFLNGMASLVRSGKKVVLMNKPDPDRDIFMAQKVDEVLTDTGSVVVWCGLAHAAIRKGPKAKWLSCAEQVKAKKPIAVLEISRSLMYCEQHDYQIDKLLNGKKEVIDAAVTSELGEYSKARLLEQNIGGGAGNRFPEVDHEKLRIIIDDFDAFLLDGRVLASAEIDKERHGSRCTTWPK